EEQLGVRLFQRTTRRVALTQEGEHFHARCRRVLDELAGLADAAAGAAREPGGVLRIDAPITYGKKAVLPVAAALAQRYPALRLDVRLSDQYADVVGSGLDAVIRIGEVADSRLVARRIGWQQLVVCGSPAYLARRGKPARPADIAAHDCAVFQMPTSGRYRAWEFLVRGRRVAMHPEPRLVVNDGEGMVSAVRAGLGIAQVPDYMTEDAVKSGELVEVLRACRPKPMPISVVFPTSRHMPPRLRAFIDALATGSARSG
ncbi:MAG TPA: LysR family transcriptional regulator, partial [Burkholderiales bacterium]|nr:LysR family transcriptional regulator [Burkholderiales bacterium]